MKTNLALNPGHGIRKLKVKNKNMMHAQCECKRILLQKRDKNITRS